MNKRWITALVLTTTIATTRPAASQDAGRFGVTLAVPAALGFIWHATDNMAFRPELNLSTSSATSSTSFLGGDSPTSNGRTWGIAVSAPFYMASQDNVRAYISPRVGYTRLTNDDEFMGTTLRSTSTQMAYSGSFGAQYAPVRRFNVFGETGVWYASSTSTADGAGGTSKVHGWSLRSAVGVILYFGR